MMERTTGGRLDTFEADNLIAKLYPQPDTFVVELETAGAYARGTVLSLESDGKYEVLGTDGAAGAAAAVLAEATLDEDTVAVAYRSGHLNRAALIVAEGYTMTAADEDALRRAGIFLSDVLPVT